ncbi:uncharacterized protein C8Q71DRAFT_295848 [Rhodofomes roseus]|uniref:Uncharacterized protein n=1 Tax=Rhodofomes roseus TaxID=34475 RepID=A0ABQ8K423_9APHY|nr:uncharacterized protein C8Q71DRAFT_295848 [Rhodofomes roseus]KAH9831621.1 hypothetical protein C8Q71DRAFT_295848 [Rhodofomes roseus]
MLCCSGTIAELLSAEMRLRSPAQAQSRFWRRLKPESRLPSGTLEPNALRVQLALLSRLCALFCSTSFAASVYQVLPARICAQASTSALSSSPESRSYIRCPRSGPLGGIHHLVLFSRLQGLGSRNLSFSSHIQPYLSVLQHAPACGVRTWITARRDAAYTGACRCVNPPA